MKQNKTTWLPLITVVALPVLSAYSQPTTAPTAPATASPVAANSLPNLAEVVKLSQAGVGDDVVTAYVRNSRSPFNLSANDILALKGAGISTPVINAMLDHDKSIPSQPAVIPPQSSAATYDQKLYAPANPSPAIPNSPTVPPAPVVPNAPGVSPAPTFAPAQPAPPLPPAHTTAVVVEQAPPTPRVDIVPVAPGPDYYWVPGYWAWRGTWVWVGGRYVARPWHGAVWVGGGWARHGRGYVWVGGGWH